jgi:formate hydrogenlyase subunit 3/multisubunit Na+/H+ antiporter MnhD subunit
MSNNVRDALILGLVVGVLSISYALWRRRNTRNVRDSEIRVRSAPFTEIGIILLIVGAVGFLAIAGGFLQSSRQWLGSISALSVAGVLSLLYSALLTMVYMAISRRRQRKSVQDSDL